VPLNAHPNQLLLAKSKEMKISIIGGGIGGLTTAIALQKEGFEVQVYEKAPKIMSVGAGLSLGVNAIKALSELGIAEEIIQYGKPITSFPILDKRGKLISKRDMGEYGLGTTQYIELLFNQY
jgi:2-polyprenyl-6-methoxyphenol hydroxylase-like FAD-dependent oxidoreductase